MLRSFSLSEVIPIFDWLGDLCSGIGDAISSAFSALWTEVSGSIWELFLKWIYTAVYNAVAEFFTSIGNLGAEIFELSWVEEALKFFSLFGWVAVGTFGSLITSVVGAIVLLWIVSLVSRRKKVR